MSATINPLLLQQTAEKLQALFQDFSPAESREQLWQLFSLTISGAFNHQSVAERQDLLVFYGHLQEVLVALESLLVEGEDSANKCPCIEKLYKSF